MRYPRWNIVDEEVAGEAEVGERGAGGRRGVGERGRNSECSRQAIEAKIEVEEGGGREKGVRNGP